MVKINCRIFEEENEVIKGMLLQLSSMSSPAAKKIRAEDTLMKLERLSACHIYDKERTDCGACALLNHLRKRTMKFVIEVANLELGRSNNDSGSNNDSNENIVD